MGASPERAPWAGGPEALLGWWSAVRPVRDALPWRHERDPWLVLVSETMLAQTQAARVAERYPEIATALASPRVTATRSVAEMLALWSGLGYYRRALLLRASAIAIVERHGGFVPEDLASLLALPGVGPYTARAVLAFSFERQVGVLDTNIGRVLARAVAGRPLRSREAQALADELTPPDRPRDWNLALMDFGALVCRSLRPECEICPLARAERCRWHTSGQVEDPARRSAATSRPQAAFSGSDREGRGRLLQAALGAPIRAAELASSSGWVDDPPRALRVARQLVAEGLLSELEDGSFELP